MKSFILSEIRRIGLEIGAAPGQAAFANATGITPAKWRGVHWLRWSDALEEAGLPANSWNQKLDTERMLLELAMLTRSLGRLPTRSEIKMQRRLDPTFPSHSTVANHFPSNSNLNEALLKLSRRQSDWADLQAVLHQPPAAPEGHKRAAKEGLVYLLKSGNHFKVGRSEDIERRFREVKIALPEAVTLVHSIRTDDPSGIEAYWHRRFAAKRANGEWFALSASDVKAFCRRTFQ
ncbi:GIY-YIG nuclease family protein [uncultured Sphingomonas sp.]|uniref:GIY-YIG nuclease family protein n=1 Tax=uncultured Sphingomonas sp. TaxID=158754 RepID=UPI0035C9D722